MSLFNIAKTCYYQLPDWLLKAGGIVYYMIPERVRYGNVFSGTLKKNSRSRIFGTGRSG